MAEIGGVPYVAWREPHGNTSLIFVARLNAAGTQWEKVGGPVNADLHALGGPQLASVGGVPYVSWSQGIAADPGNPTNGGTTCDKWEPRVARLNAAGNGWIQPWRGEDAMHGGFKYDPAKCASVPKIASVNGVPYLAWDEEAFGGASSTVRVARLDTSTVPFATWVEPWTGVDATHGGLPQQGHYYGFEPDVASIDGVPYVAWSENETQIQVARLNGNTWEQPWSHVTATYGGINQSMSLDLADGPLLASIRSFPYVAWSEAALVGPGQSGPSEVRVARLDTSTFGGPTWTQEAAGVSDTDGRINQSPNQSGSPGGLAAAKAGPSGVEVPYVAWDENTVTGSGTTIAQIRVARFDANAHSWEQPWAGVTQTYGAINLDPTKSAALVGFTTIGGVPWLASLDSGVRVERLEPDFSSLSVTPSATGATFSVVARTFGIGYPIGFEYGNVLQHDSSIQTGALGSESVTVTTRVTGLTPATTYQFRPFALAGVDLPRALGTTLSFTTAAAPRNPSGRATISALSETNSVFVAGRASTALSGRTAAARHKTATVFSFRLDLPATVKIAIQTTGRGRRVGRSCKPATRALRHRPACTRTVTVATLSRTAHAGRNRVTFSARIRGNAIRPGRYEAVFTPRNAAGPSACGTLGFTVVKS